MSVIQIVAVVILCGEVERRHNISIHHFFSAVQCQEIYSCTSTATYDVTSSSVIIVQQHAVGESSIASTSSVVRGALTIADSTEINLLLHIPTCNIIPSLHLFSPFIFISLAAAYSTLLAFGSCVSLTRRETRVLQVGTRQGGLHCIASNKVWSFCGGGSSCLVTGFRKLSIDFITHHLSRCHPLVIRPNINGGRVTNKRPLKTAAPFQLQMLFSTSDDRRWMTGRREVQMIAAEHNHHIAFFDSI